MATPRAGPDPGPRGGGGTPGAPAPRPQRSAVARRAGKHNPTVRWARPGRRQEKRLPITRERRVDTEGGQKRPTQTPTPSPPHQGPERPRPAANGPNHPRSPGSKGGRAARQGGRRPRREPGGLGKGGRRLPVGLGVQGRVKPAFNGSAGFRLPRAIRPLAQTCARAPVGGTARGRQEGVNKGAPKTRGGRTTAQGGSGKGELDHETGPRAGATRNPAQGHETGPRAKPKPTRVITLVAQALRACPTLAWAAPGNSGSASAAKR